MTNKTMRRQDVWRLNYQKRRYLKSASEDVIAARLRAVTENLTTLTAGGKIGFVHPDLGGREWLELVAHVQEEYRLRGIAGPPDGFLADALVPKASHPEIPAAAKATADISLPTDRPYLVKLGRRKHMESLYERGAMRIAAASSYADPSLNAAVRDDELSISVVALKDELTGQLVDKTTGVRAGRLELRADATITRTSTTNYYAYCMAHKLDIRLFGDFGYDACVLITDPATFASRLQANMQERLVGWTTWHQAVSYIDPYRHRGEVPVVYAAKHFKFWYQKEYRFVWLPPLGYQGAFEAINTEIGSLESCAQLVLL